MLLGSDSLLFFFPVVIAYLCPCPLLTPLCLCLQDFARDHEGGSAVFLEVFSLLVLLWWVSWLLCWRCFSGCLNKKRCSLNLLKKVSNKFVQDTLPATEFRRDVPESSARNVQDVMFKNLSQETCWTTLTEGSRWSAHHFASPYDILFNTLFASESMYRELLGHHCWTFVFL